LHGEYLVEPPADDPLPRQAPKVQQGAGRVGQTGRLRQIQDGDGLVRAAERKTVSVL
jgi:hypothetical protein